MFSPESFILLEIVNFGETADMIIGTASAEFPLKIAPYTWLLYHIVNLCNSLSLRGVDKVSYFP
jgi:hypothetical protein